MVSTLSRIGVCLARLSVLSALLNSSLCAAEQTRFTRDTTTEQIQYQYEWLDSNRQPQDLSFALDLDAVAMLPTVQRNYQPSVAQRHIIVSLFHHARTYDPRDVRIDIKPQGEAINIEVASRFPEKIPMYEREMRAQERTAREEYLHKNYYEQYQTRLNERAIKPDHLRYINESTRALIPLSQALYEKLDASSDAREYINLMLGWLQTIPYSTLTDRITTNGAGFLPPITLLNSNKGDCDSKTVLAASIIRAFLPNVPMRIVFLRNHALLAVNLTVGPNDESIMIDGLSYVLMEPTGPAQMPLGEVGAQSLLAVRQGTYTTQSVEPANIATN